MGNCFGVEPDASTAEDLEARREQQLQAAMKRRDDEENRGIKDAEGYKIRQEKKRKVEEEADKRGHVSQDTAMRWNVG
ncbi:small VCP/p97-interacting protein-like [Dysidea avara]|uniref:small VCP/p97-interacting protein-like n=1 Tax=Dysidea avara TaxID=196820 RepID=UPI0033238C73